MPSPAADPAIPHKRDRDRRPASGARPFGMLAFLAHEFRIRPGVRRGRRVILSLLSYHDLSGHERPVSAVFPFSTQAPTSAAGPDSYRTIKKRARPSVKDGLREHQVLCALAQKENFTPKRPDHGANRLDHWLKAGCTSFASGTRFCSRGQ